MRAKSLSVLTAACVLLAAPVCAAAPAPTLGGGNSKAPIDITSDHAVAYNNDCTAVWTGHAEALQDNARLRADVLTAYLEKKAPSAPGSSGDCGDLLRLEANGSVYYATPDQKVHGDKAIYVAADDTVTVIGDVVAVRGQNVLRGDRMVLNNRTGEGHMEGNATGRNKADRPRGVFYPKQSSGPGASASKSKPARSAEAGAAPNPWSAGSPPPADR